MSGSWTASNCLKYDANWDHGPGVWSPCGLVSFALFQSHSLYVLLAPTVCIWMWWKNINESEYICCHYSNVTQSTHSFFVLSVSNLPFQLQHITPILHIKKKKKHPFCSTLKWRKTPIFWNYAKHLSEVIQKQALKVYWTKKMASALSKRNWSTESSFTM